MQINIIQRMNEKIRLIMTVRDNIPSARDKTYSSEALCSDFLFLTKSSLLVLPLTSVAIN